jgi:ADP-ribose pyrophosphatase
VSDKPGGGFRQVGEHDRHAWRSFRLVEAEFVAGDGTPFTRTILRHPGAAAIVPIDGEDVVLVRQFRPALGAELLEIPAGTLDRPDESPSACAARELEEEIGARATRLDHLVSYAVAPGVSDERLHLYLATGLTFGARAADGIEEQAMTVERLPLDDAVAACADGRIQDAKTIVGILLATRRGH